MNDLNKKIQTAYETGERESPRALFNEARQAANITREQQLHAAAIALEYQDYDFAETVYQQVIADNVKDVQSRNLYARALVQIGKFDDAKAMLLEALTVNDLPGETYFNLAQITRGDEQEQLIKKLEALLQEPNITKGDEYAYRLSLGKFYDDLGAYDVAFGHFTSAKKLPSVTYDHAAQTAYFEQLKTVFSKELLTENRGAGSTSSAPIFIVGMPRSGSTLLEALLSQHPDIAGIGERVELTFVIQDLVRKHQASAGYLDVIPQLPKDEFMRLGEEYVAKTAPLAPDAKFRTDKNLLNFQRIGFIDLTLPNAAILHCRRNIIDTCLSCYFQSLDPNIYPFTFDLANLGAYYALYADLMAHWDTVAPGRVQHVDYEAVIAEPQAESERIFKAISISGKKSKDKEQRERVIATSSAWQARQPVYETSVDRWRNYERHLGPLFESLEKHGLLTGDKTIQ